MYYVVCLQESRADVGPSVYDTHNPGVQSIIDTRLRASFGCGIGNTKVIGPGQIGTIGTRLIPSLHRSTDGAQDDGEVEGRRLTPFVKDFVAKGITFDFVQLGDLLKSRRILCHQGTLFQERNHILHVCLLGELLDIVKQGVTGYAGQRILNSRWVEGQTEFDEALKVRLDSTHLAVTLRFKLTDC